MAALAADEAFALQLLSDEADEASRKPERIECVVCLDAAAELRFTCTCGHLVCCIMCSTSLPQSGMPSVVRCPVCRSPTHGQSMCLGADCRRCRLAPPSTGPQPTFEPSSASSITNPSVVGPSVGSAAADPQPESWSEWAERLVQEQNAIVSMHHIPVLAGLGIYDLECRPWGQNLTSSVRGFKR